MHRVHNVLRLTTLGAMVLLIDLVGCSSSHPAGPAVAQSAAPQPPVAVAPVRYDYLGLVRSHAVSDMVLLQGEECVDGKPCVESIDADGDSVTIDSLDGKVVEVHTVSRAEKTISVKVRRAVIGPIESMDLAHARMTVLGQEVYFYGLGGEAFQPAFGIGDVVEVNGFVAGDGRILATRVDPLPAGQARFLVRGILASGSDGRLQIGSLALDLGAASVDGFPASSPLAGDAVVVVGRLSSDGSLAVDTARFDASRWVLGPVTDGDFVFVQGVVTAMRSVLDFDLGGQRVFDNYDYYVGAPVGSQLTITKEGDAVGVYSGLDVAGDVHLIGRADRIDSVEHRLDVLGFDVQALPLRYASSDDYKNADGRAISLADIAPSDFVEVSGRTVGSTILALSLRVVTAERAASSGNIVSDLFHAEFPNLRFLNQLVTLDAATSVEICDGPGDYYCPAASQSVIFDLASRSPTLSVYLQPSGPAAAAPLRASRILVDRL